MSIVLGDVEYGPEKTKIHLLVDEITSGCYLRTTSKDSENIYEISPAISRPESSSYDANSKIEIPKHNSIFSVIPMVRKSTLQMTYDNMNRLTSGRVEDPLPEDAEEILEEDLVPGQLLSRNYKPQIYTINIPSSPCQISLVNSRNQTLNSISLVPTEFVEIIFVVSCDHPEADTSQSLWKKLHSDIIPGSICLHLGDNVYADRAYNEAIANPNIDPVAFYRARYRKTWFRTEKSMVLSSLPNLMNMDDHEITNDKIYDPANPVDKAAITAFKEYQYSLLINPRRFSKKNYSWYKRKKDLLIISFERTTRGIPSIGDLITDIEEAIENCLAADEHAMGNDLFYEPLAAVVICTGWACIPAPEGNLRADVYATLFGESKFMSKDYLNDLYFALFKYGASLQIILCGGDIHFGILGSVTSIDYPEIEISIMISSAISNHPSVDRKLASQAYLQNNTIGVGTNIEFHVKETRARRCYGKIHIIRGEETCLEPELVFSEKTRPKSWKNYLTSIYNMRP